jgi:death-on-curing family protein
MRDAFIKAGFERKTFTKIDDLLYPTAETVISIHDFLISFFRGQQDEIHKGAPNVANIEFNLFAAQRIGEDSPDRREKLVIKAAHIMNQFFTSHAFTDGNKRTGFVLAWLFIQMNGGNPKDVLSNYQSHVQTFVKVAAREMHHPDNIPELMGWIKNNLIQN